MWWQSIAPVFSVTWCFRNNSNMLILCLRNIYYHQLWKQLCCLIVLYFFSLWMNEWWIFYVALCVLLYTQSTLQSCGGVSPQPPPVCSIHLDDTTAATGQRRQCAHHTPATGGEERDIEPIKWMGIIRRPLLFTRSAMATDNIRRCFAVLMQTWKRSWIPI